MVTVLTGPAQVRRTVPWPEVIGVSPHSLARNGWSLVPVPWMLLPRT
jgi:hypothetical protein